MPKKRAKIGYKRAKGGKHRTKKELAQRAAPPLPTAPDVVTAVPPSPKRRKAAVAAEDKFAESARTCITETFCPISNESKRSAIACCYYYTFDAPPEEAWAGKGGTIGQICNELDFGGLNSYGSVRRVLYDVKVAMEGGWEYCPAKNAGSGGKNVLIPTGSYYSQLVADCMEDGLGLRTTMHIVNEERAEEDPPLQHVGLSAIMSAYHRLKPHVSGIKRVKQGSDDPEADWCKARFRWVLQLLIRLGEKDPTMDELKALGVLTAEAIRWLHDDAMEAKSDLKKRSRATYEGNQ